MPTLALSPDIDILATILLQLSSPALLCVAISLHSLQGLEASMSSVECTELASAMPCEDLSLPVAVKMLKPFECWVTGCQGWAANPREMQLRNQPDRPGRARCGALKEDPLSTSYIQL